MAARKQKQNAFAVLQDGASIYERKLKYGLEEIERHVIYIPRSQAWPDGKANVSPDTLLSELKLHADKLLVPDTVKDANGTLRQIDSRQVAFLALNESAPQSYYYAGAQHQGHQAPAKVQETLNSLLHYWKTSDLFHKTCFKKPFTNFQLNRYTPQGQISWHADSQPTMDHQEPIVSVSLGSKRKFQMRVLVGETESDELFVTPTNEIKTVLRNCKKRFNGRGPPQFVFRDFILHHGDVLVMLANCQFVCQHRVAPAYKKEQKELEQDEFGGIRYNITMRKFL